MGIEYIFNVSADDNTGNIDTLKDRSTIQKNIYILKERANRDFKKFNKGKYNILHLGKK